NLRDRSRWIGNEERPVDRRELLVEVDQRPNPGRADVGGALQVEADHMRALAHHVADAGGQMLRPVAVEPARYHQLQMIFPLGPYDFHCVTYECTLPYSRVECKAAGVQ